VPHPSSSPESPRSLPPRLDCCSISPPPVVGPFDSGPCPAVDMVPDDGTRRRSPCPPVVAPSMTTTKLLPAASPRCYQRLNSFSRTPSQQHPRRCTNRNALQQPWPPNTSNDDDEDLIRPARSTTPNSENNKTKPQSTQQDKKILQNKNLETQKNPKLHQVP